MSIELSEEQLKVFNKSGKFVVSACAGSGKTFTISKKLAHLIENNPNRYQGIATISFTNVAWKEIRDNLDEWGISADYPHFLGTIDHFINNEIFFKYYYLLDIFKKRPILVGDHAVNWKYKQYDIDYNQYFDVVSFDNNDDLVVNSDARLFFGKLNKYNNDGSPNKHYSNVIGMKRNNFSKGYVSQKDINYFSLLLLKNYPFIIGIIANKFHSFLIDEAQDTSEIQLEILKLISNHNNIKNFIFIGDFNQAIFEWNDARPDLFKSLTKDFELITFNENWRSSQKICDFANKLVDGEEFSVAMNTEIKDFSVDPVIKPYSKYSEVIDYFLDLCETQKENKNISFDKDNVAIIARGNNVLKEINNKNFSNKYEWDKNLFTREIVYSKFLFDNNEYKDAFSTLEKVLISLIKDDFHISYSDYEKFIKEIGFFDFKIYIFKLLNLMPFTKDKRIKEWLSEFRLNLNSSNIRFKKELIKQLNWNEDNDNVLIELLFDESKENNLDYTLSSIHGIKGKSFDACLLILKTKSNKYYKTLLKDFKKSKSKDEELRNVYVALTRPKKILVLGVPLKDKELWETFFDKSPQSNLDSFF